MSRYPIRDEENPARLATQRALGALERFLQVEAVGGIVLLIAAGAALIWANSPAHQSYEHFWLTPLTLGLGDHVASQSLRFWINDGLMTWFFLLVGMEIRREIHEGALSSAQLAALPLAAAIGGVTLPALIYLAVNAEPVLRQGWAVATATDIAFAVGVLALLGKSVPGAVRILLLALAIIDDIVAVLIIALFYSSHLDASALVIAGIGVLGVVGLRRMGIGNAYAYLFPGGILWLGLLQTGVHPTLAGVVLGLMTPVLPLRTRERPAEVATRALNDLHARAEKPHQNLHVLMQPLKELRQAQREILPPVVRVQAALHPWVAYGVMPLFALANAGVRLEGFGFGAFDGLRIGAGVVAGLVIGKPAGILLGSWAAVRLGWCRLPAAMTWSDVTLVGCLGGIGFTMSIFIANLAFQDDTQVVAAKAGVLIASVTAATLGLTFGRLRSRDARAPDSRADRDNPVGIARSIGQRRR